LVLVILHIYALVLSGRKSTGNIRFKFCINLPLFNVENKICNLRRR
jgi:hypothetical protein